MTKYFQFHSFRGYVIKEIDKSVQGSRKESMV